MKPIGPLMREHRLIERMVRVIGEGVDRISREKTLEYGFVEAIVDFFRTYADRTHHGKEEDILFRDLAGKEISPELRKIEEELVAEHRLAREIVGSLFSAGQSYRQGNADALQDIIAILVELTKLYPAHIEREDKHFFYPVQDYFSRDEQDKMLQEFREFDRSMIHEKYRKVVKGFEGDG